MQVHQLQPAVITLVLNQCMVVTIHRFLMVYHTKHYFNSLGLYLTFYSKMIIFSCTAALLSFDV